MFDAYISLLIFSFLLLGTPGPAPLAIAATGAVFGIKKGFNFLAGLLAGFALVLCIQGIALYLVVDKDSATMQALQVFGFIYMLYIAYKIATAPAIKDDAQASSPPNFFDGLILNLTNPKAYAALVTINSQVLLPYADSAMAYFITALICFMVVVIIDLAWLFLGKLLRPMMQNPSIGRIIRMIFAASMVAAVVWVMVKH